MKIKKLSRAASRSRRHKMLVTWHSKYAWFPTRISEEELVWLDIYYRKANSVSSQGKVGRFDRRSKEDHMVAVLADMS